HAQHVLEVDDAERRLARHEDERAPFLEGNIGRALDERARRTVRNGGERAHRTRAHHHPARARRARGRRRASIAVVVHGHRRIPARGATSRTAYGAPDAPVIATTTGGTRPSVTAAPARRARSRRT